jgi:REP element-mobilizing transposase RayT
VPDARQRDTSGVALAAAGLITFCMTDSRYAKNAGAVFSLKHHFVWCPKYRRPVLAPPIDVRLKELLAEIAKEHGMTLRAVEVMPDHVHLLWRAIQRGAPPKSSTVSRGARAAYCGMNS